MTSRQSFLARLNSRRGETGHENVAHPVPGPLVGIPPVESRLVDDDDLVGSFCSNARTAGATVHLVASRTDFAAVVPYLIERHSIRRVVASKQRDAWPLVEQFSGATEVTPFDEASAAAADLGISAASVAIAATGSIVQASNDIGGRTVSLLARVHLCVVPASRIVATTLDAFLVQRDLGFPSNLVLVTGPSKSGDIEQILVTGVHGPVALELAVIQDI